MKIVLPSLANAAARALAPAPGRRRGNAAPQPHRARAVPATPTPHGRITAAPPTRLPRTLHAPPARRPRLGGHRFGAEIRQAKWRAPRHALHFVNFAPSHALAGAVERGQNAGP